MLRAALTILTILATHAYGQYPLDSLWRAFQGQKVSREQLVTLHQIITEMRSVDQDSCLNLSHLLVDRAREQHDTLMIGQGYRDVGIAHLMMRSSEPALKALDSALFTIPPDWTRPSCAVLERRKATWHMHTRTVGD
ncbi:MAG: hypothetical protein IPI91_14290 [Flavobacteriales bacterium]|nr:hypothetical protein [Flavobacteriales bacterium]